MPDIKIIPHLLLCYDGTFASHRAILYLEKVFKDTKLEITLLKIIDYPLEFDIFEEDLYKKLEKEIRLEKEVKGIYLKTEEELKKIATKLKEKIGALVNIKIAFKSGDIGRAIARLAQDELFDGIVVGRRGLSKMMGFVLGSVTHKLISFSSIPVWLIRGEDWNKNFLVAFDLGEPGLKVIDYASFLLSFNKNANITFLHIYYPFSSLRDFEGNIDELIKISDSEYKKFFIKIKKNLEENNLSSQEIRFKIKRGLFGPAGEIIRTAKKGDYTTIIVGRRGIGGVREFILGSVSQKIVSYFGDRAIWVVN